MKTLSKEMVVSFRFSILTGVFVKSFVIGQIRCLAFEHDVNVETERLCGWVVQRTAIRLTGTCENVLAVTGVLRAYFQKLEKEFESST